MSQIVIIGSGTGGMFAAALLRRRAPEHHITLIDPAETHYYQPLWTLVGGGETRKEDSARPTASLLPPGAKWVPEAAQRIDPDNRCVTTDAGTQIDYDVLIVAPGIRIDWHKIEGLKGNVGRGGIVSIYGYSDAEDTYEALDAFGGGTALFTMPATPIKCAGAPQKIAYLADDIFRRNGVHDNTSVIYCTGGGKIFGVAAFAETLDRVVARRGIDARFSHELKRVDAEAKRATFAVADGDPVVIDYDLLHVVPPMSAPDFIHESGLSAEGDTFGWVDVDKYTTQHTRHPDIFALGDASSLPTSRTGAAIREQAPVLVHNVIKHLEGVAPSDAWRQYSGYAACPLITGFGKLVLAEFDYDLTPTPSFPIDTTKERWSMYQMKKHILPRVYWNMMLKGRTF